MQRSKLFLWNCYNCYIFRISALTSSTGWERQVRGDRLSDIHFFPVPEISRNFRDNLSDISRKGRRTCKRTVELWRFVSVNTDSPKFDTRARSALGLELKQQILLVSCLFSFPSCLPSCSHTGYGSGSTCYRYMMRKNRLGYPSLMLSLLFALRRDGDTWYF